MVAEVLAPHEKYESGASKFEETNGKWLSASSKCMMAVRISQSLSLEVRTENWIWEGREKTYRHKQQQSHRCCEVRDEEI